MKVLLTNNTLAGYAGTELYVRDVALELLRRGHQPMAYSTSLGAVAEELRAAGVPAVQALADLAETPDIIHAQHHYDTLTALTWFAQTPAVYFCHGAVPWEERPFRFPQILRYVAVDEACRERLIVEGGVPADDIEMILNFYDAARFAPRPPLPAKPSRALAFGNVFSEAGALPALREACRACGLSLDAAGLGVDRTAAEPGPLLRHYDVVFAKGRSAIEAMGVGAAVILCGDEKMGPLVTAANFYSLQRANFGFRTLTRPLTAQAVAAELRSYDAPDADAVALHVREHCELKPAVDRILGVYEQVLAAAASRPPPSPLARSQAVSSYLRQTAAHHKNSDAMLFRKAAIEDSQRQTAVLERLEREMEAMRALAMDRERQINEIQASATWRWTQGLLANRLVQRLLGRTIRRVAERSRPDPPAAI